MLSTVAWALHAICTARSSASRLALGVLTGKDPRRPIGPSQADIISLYFASGRSSKGG
jgi:hypothetical protein